MLTRAGAMKLSIVIFAILFFWAVVVRIEVLLLKLAFELVGRLDECWRC
jgi:hypothetical protein